MSRLPNQPWRCQHTLTASYMPVDLDPEMVKIINVLMNALREHIDTKTESGQK